ncbi:MAG: MraY family glycosyltransferase [Candidatus Cryosericum sp.]
MILIVWAIGVCLVAFGVGFLVATCGVRVGLVDVPNSRSSHAEVTPRAGGLGISIAGVVAGVAGELPVLAWLPMVGIAGLGLVDDRWRVKPRLRLLVQCMLAGLSTMWLLRQTGLPVMIVVGLAILFVLILVGTTNIYNFMDGSNGMAGLMGVVVFGTLAVVSFTFARNIEIGRVALIIAAACCGFLPLNLRRRARIFMGDVGSTFLGFTAALLALRLWTREPAWGLCALGAMTVFYVDSGWTLLVRLCRHERLFEAHREHAYQRLVNELGWSHPAASVMYAGIQSIISILLVVSVRWGCRTMIGELAVVVIVLSCLYWCVQEKAVRRP